MTDRIQAAIDYIREMHPDIDIRGSGTARLCLCPPPRCSGIDVLIERLKNTYKAARVDQSCTNNDGSVAILYEVFWNPQDTTGDIDERPVDLSPSALPLATALPMLRSPTLTWAALCLILAYSVLNFGDRIVNTVVALPSF